MIDGLMTASEVARRLGGISSAYVSDLARQARLVPARVAANGWKLYDPEDVERFAATFARARMWRDPRRKEGTRGIGKRGRLAAIAFESFARGEDLRAVVVRTQLPPDVVRELYEEWCTPLETRRQERLEREREREEDRQRREVENQERRAEMARLRRRELDIRERELRKRT